MSYGGGLNKEDRILIAQLSEEIIGAVRLCPDNGFSVLRGMQILAPFQRQGIGTQLLRACAEQLVDQVCYCIPVAASTIILSTSRGFKKFHQSKFQLYYVSDLMDTFLGE